MTRRIDAILFDLGGVLIELAGVEQMLAWSPGVADTRRAVAALAAARRAVRRFETGRDRRATRSRRDRRRIRRAGCAPTSSSPRSRGGRAALYPGAIEPACVELRAALPARQRVEHQRDPLGALQRRVVARSPCSTTTFRRIASASSSPTPTTSSTCSTTLDVAPARACSSSTTTRSTSRRPRALGMHARARGRRSDGGVRRSPSSEELAQ